MEENGDRQFDIDELQKYQITSKNFLMLTKRGTFYNAIDEDAFIISYLFNYKIIKNNVAGFPECSLIKVLNKLDEQKISYEVTYKDREPIIKRYNNINKYNAVLKKALEYQSLNQRIILIQEKINSIKDGEVLNRILKVLENELW